MFVALGVTCMGRAQGVSRTAASFADTPASAFSAQTPPAFAIRTNLVYLASTAILSKSLQVTPNLGVEIGLSIKMTLNVIAGYNPWKPPKCDDENNPNYEKSQKNHKLQHFLIEPEIRYWFCERFNGISVGIHGIYSQYNIGGYDIPPLFKKTWKDPKTNTIHEVRYGGTKKPERKYGVAYGGGVSFNYHWMLAKHLGLEFSLGVGLVYMQYGKHECKLCGNWLQDFTQTAMTPTKIGINLIYVIK